MFNWLRRALAALDRMYEQRLRRASGLGVQPPSVTHKTGSDDRNAEIANVRRGTIVAPAPLPYDRAPGLSEALASSPVIPAVADAARPDKSAVVEAGQRAPQERAAASQLPEDDSEAEIINIPPGDSTPRRHS